nr:PREDICTED: uncharacterized protein LOC109042037 [Bemisia tabaci]XP_018914137.1 PREDICTED: uncharacterized protein LOC109042037 [Bemisia tabaci]XP_018914138.1 PREDICTED: uncharacterized protein LOC109042037 [Bemisia tabaci]XP_018914139.1 PREDICTED: uncharacterized protein LOC109042037 [Bemisia tabaci]
MEKLNYYVLCFLLLTSYSASDVQKDGKAETAAEAEARLNRLSEEVRAVLEHYKDPDPVGLPNDPVPDPMPIPDIKHSFSLHTMTLRNITVHGLSKFRIDNAFSDLVDMQVSMGVKMDNLMVFGNHTISTWLSSSSGGFNVTLVGIYIEAIAMLEVARGGYLEATDIKMDIVFQDIEMDFQNLGLMGSFFQGMINTVGTFIFDSIKPYILSQINLQAGINKNLRDIPQTFPNSIPPLDLAVAEGRKYVRGKGFDPYKIADYHYSSHLLTLDITHTWLYGLASFYRVGNITAQMEKNALDIVVHVGTQKLEGTCQWEASTLMSFLSKNGMTSFSIDYFHVYARINQTLDTRNHPMLTDLQLKLGNIQLRMEGTGTLDYVLELLVNVLPNVLRYQIMDAVEIPLKRRIQEILNSIDVSKLIEENMNNLVASKKNRTDVQSVTSKPFDEEGLVIHGKALNEDMNQNVSIIAR